jgi:hypothetical protein
MDIEVEILSKEMCVMCGAFYDTEKCSHCGGFYCTLHGQHVDGSWYCKYCGRQRLPIRKVYIEPTVDHTRPVLFGEVE